MKFSFKLKIDPRDFQTTEGFESIALIMIVIKNDNKTPSLVAVDYNIGDEMQILRAGHPIESMIDTNEMKYFKFVNSDPKVQAVKIYVSSIRGDVSVRGSRTDPRLIDQYEIDSVGNRVYFIDDLNDPMYVIVEGLTPAAFGITVQLSHE